MGRHERFRVFAQSTHDQVKNHFAHFRGHNKCFEKFYFQFSLRNLFFKVKDTKNEEIILPLLLTQFFLICRCIAESQKKVNN